MNEIADGLVAVVKRGCPTCELVRPVLTHLAKADARTSSHGGVAAASGCGP